MKNLYDMKNLYEVTFQFKRGAWYGRMIHLEAKNIPEAKQLAKDLWYSSYKPHMFSIKIRRVPLDECIDMAHWFVKCNPDLAK